MKKKPFSWVEFLLKYWSGILGISGVLVAVIVFLATLSPRLSAAEKKNTEQDSVLNRLGTIAEQNQQLLDRWDGIYQQQQSQGLREWDGDAFWCCDLNDREQCFSANQWYKCR